MVAWKMSTQHARDVLVFSISGPDKLSRDQLKSCDLSPRRKRYRTQKSSSIAFKMTSVSSVVN